MYKLNTDLQPIHPCPSYLPFCPIFSKGNSPPKQDKPMKTTPFKEHNFVEIENTKNHSRNNFCFTIYGALLSR